MLAWGTRLRRSNSSTQRFDLEHYSTTSQMKHQPTTKELQSQAIEAAKAMEWMVCSEGTDYTACVIAWSKGPGTNNGLATNWCRVMTIVDGQALTETVRCNPTVMASGYISEHLADFKLNTTNYWSNGLPLIQDRTKQLCNTGCLQSSRVT